MDGELHIDFVGLDDFATRIRSSAGWLLLQCGTPASSAVAAALGASRWPDDSLRFFGVRWDQEIAALSSAIHNYVEGLEAVVTAYSGTDNSLTNR